MKDSIPKINLVDVLRENCSYSPIKDITPVAADDSIDLHEAFVTGFVPNESAVSESDYQNVDDPRSIVGRPANEFEAIHMVQSLKAAHDETVAAAET